MYAVAWKRKFDKQLYWNVDWAVTVNQGIVQYGVGVGGRTLTTDRERHVHTCYGAFELRLHDLARLPYRGVLNRTQPQVPPRAEPSGPSRIIGAEPRCGRTGRCTAD